MRKLVVANWKMNPQSYRVAEKLVRKVGKGARDLRGRVSVVLCPPFPWLTDFSHRKSSFEFGAQDVFWKKEGAYTGEVSPSMLKNSRVSFVIVGHSERRALGETDDVVAKKVKSALESGLKVILCVGESSRAEVEYQGKMIPGVAFALKQEMGAVLKVLKREHLKHLVVAYEPIWAIGTGKADTPQNALEAITLIRSLIARKFGPKIAYATRVLYGGSVNPKNIASFISQKGIDGVLVGGASLGAKSFLEIVRISASV